MRNVLACFINELQSTDSMEDYESVVRKFVGILESEEHYLVAGEVKNAAKVQINKLSVASTRSNFQNSKERLMDYLQRELRQTETSFEEQLILTVLNRFSDYCMAMFSGERIHAKCNSALKELLPQITIENEYDLHHLIYPILLMLFPDCKDEKTYDSGHHSIREDFTIESYRASIELKCTRNNMTERDLSEEVASDITHYDNDYLFFYIYDKENIIKNKFNFIQTYESKKVDEKRIHVVVFQPNILI